MVELLQGTVRPYAWGSRTAIAELLGQPAPAPHPQAELWLGAHPVDSSVLLRPDGSQTALAEAVAADPQRHLGTAADRWGARLSFLFKVVAAEEALSLQAHPTAAQAADGFARERSGRAAPDAAHRNYADPHHKPELLCALTEFRALAGFRPVREVVALLTALGGGELGRYRELLAAQPDLDGLRTLLTTWITLPQPTVDALLDELTAGCVELVRRDSPFARQCRVLLQLAEAHPGDAGVLAAALLNQVTLAPGRALYLAPGTLHTYLHGTGIEVMANSDNVLRGGLTTKHVDVVELLRVVDFDDTPPPVLTGRPAGPHRVTYPTPAEEFELCRVEWSADETPWAPVVVGGPRVLFVTRDAVRLHTAAGHALDLQQGSAAWLAAADPAVTVCPHGAAPQVFAAGPGPVQR